MYTYRLAQPDSQKGTLEKAGDYAKGTGDKAASMVQPNVGFFFFIHHHSDSIIHNPQ
jgi:hypothetical protein